MTRPTYLAPAARVTHPSAYELPEDCTPRLPAVPWRTVLVGLADLAIVAMFLLAVLYGPDLAAYLADQSATSGGLPANSAGLRVIR